MRSVHWPAYGHRSPSDLQARQTRGGGGWRGATWNEMEYSSTPDKVAAYEEDELNCMDGDNLRSTRRANRRYPNAFGIEHSWIGSIWIGDILAEGGRRMPYFLSEEELKFTLKVLLLPKMLSKG
ncbi:hypothetical protein EWE74_02600 [Sphingobacterium corticibacterium]|uniref:Uncharacterized protein n=1 Tax=Sphingobacterium corticibacterium TaxID=2484746 RepID=A0A4Q6XY80_9SPHI|nr:hypothetical protein EWE74_02600 [Sphingobacterium corticibacterium]